MIETDGAHYQELVKACNETRGIPGATFEIGVRRGGSSQLIMESMKGTRKLHIAVDPYGAIDYEDIVGVHKTDYTNQMKNETLASLYSWCRDNDCDFIFYNLEDVEFFKRFPEGVPYYYDTKVIVDSFSLAFIDGPHATLPVLEAFKWLKDKMSVGGQIVFDNYDHYPHDSEVEVEILKHNYKLINTGADKKIYVKYENS
jgi:hypothetical protein